MAQAIKARHTIDARLAHAERRAKNLELHEQRRKDTHVALLQNEYIRHKEITKRHPGIPHDHEFRARKRTIKQLLLELEAHRSRRQGLPAF